MNKLTRILLVEDSQKQADFIVSAFDPKEFDVSVISDGNEAYTKLVEQKQIPDVILLDHQLPGKSGLQIIEGLYGTGETYAIIFLTANKSMENAVKAMKMGALDFVLKSPHIREELPEKVRKVSQIHNERLERISLRRELRKREAIYRTMVDNIPKSIVALFGTDLNVISLNSLGLKILRITQDDIIGKNIARYKYNAMMREVIQALNLANKGIKSEFELNYKGSIFLVFVAPVKDETGLVDALVLSALNITRRKKVENKIKQVGVSLRETNAAKDTIFSIISHDLRGPVSNFAQLAQLLIDMPDERKLLRGNHILHALRDSAKRTYQLLENLLHWSKSIRGKVEAVPKKVLLNEIFLENIELANTTANNKDVTIDTQIGNECHILADPILLNTVIRNLISNAIKFTEPGGVVKLYSEIGATEVTIFIADNGVGISEQNMQRLFKLNKHFTTYGTHSEKGSGLGLLLCKDLVELNGGTISLKSTESQGTSVSFTVPKAD